MRLAGSIGTKFAGNAANIGARFANPAVTTAAMSEADKTAELQDASIAARSANRDAITATTFASLAAITGMTSANPAVTVTTAASVVAGPSAAATPGAGGIAGIQRGITTEMAAFIADIKAAAV